MIHDKKSHAAALLLTAAAGCTLLTACGSGNSTAERGAEKYSAQPAETTTTTSRDRHEDTTTRRDATTDTTARTTETTEDGLMDKVDSAIDDAEDAVTSVLREATKEVHPFD